MSKRSPYPEEISGIVDHVLRVHRVNTKWRIVELCEDEWRRVSIWRGSLDEQSLRGFRYIEGILRDPDANTDLDEPTLLKIKEYLRLFKLGHVEYGATLVPADYLESDAMLILVKEILTSSQAMPFPEPAVINLAEQNGDVDALVAVNHARFSKISRKEKLTALAHEALHIVGNKRDLGQSFESIETQAKRLVQDFEKKCKRKQGLR